MSNFSYYRPGVSDRAPLNRTNYDGKWAPQSSLASPYTGRSLASPHVRLDPFSVFDKMFAGRTTYVVSQNDLASPYISGQWSILFDDPYPDTNYVAVVTVEDPNFSPPYSVIVPAQIQKTTLGVTGFLTAPAGMGQVGHVLTIHVICIHD